ncbi:MAG: TIGR02186 family protein, partial [Methyloceanibacter sp.]
MRTALFIILLALSPVAAAVAQPPHQEEVQADISTREVSIHSDFTGIEILIFGSVDFSHAASPDEPGYDVIMVIRAPEEPIVARRKERVAGIWVNAAGKTFPSVPGFYAVLSSSPLRAITSEKTLKVLGIGLANLHFGWFTQGEPQEDAFRVAMIRLKQEQNLFQEHDEGVSFIGRSLFRATVDLPVNVPVGR